jgi:hypothetical protein
MTNSGATQEGWSRGYVVSSNLFLSLEGRREESMPTDERAVHNNIMEAKNIFMDSMDSMDSIDGWTDTVSFSIAAACSLGSADKCWPRSSESSVS